MTVYSDVFSLFPTLKMNVQSKRPRNSKAAITCSRSHVYRRGPWKLILGQHAIPLAEVELFREPVNWIAEDGNICDTFAEMAIW